MRIGALFPSLELTEPSAVRDYAQAAEDLGYVHLTTWDHVVGADPTERPDWVGPNTLQDIHEPFVLLGYLAALTRRVELATGVLALPQRQTVLVAKQSAEVDVLSEGRLRLGVGLGWVEPEFRALNETFGNRGRRVEEQIAVLRALFTQDVVTFHGNWHDIEAMGLRPLPRQRPVPIWIGGDAVAAVRRAATVGDGWMPTMGPDEAERNGCVERLAGYARDAGRDPDSVGIDALVTLLEDGPHPPPGASPREPEEVAADVARWQALGASHLTVNTTGFGAVDAHIGALRRFREIAALPEHEGA
jgi:probable F420-dependent oxidoreductase